MSQLLSISVRRTIKIPLVGLLDISAFSSNYARLIRDGILKDTARGIDSSGSSFPPYSKRHKAFRRKMGKQVGHRDLHLSGRMMSSIKITPGTDQTRVTITDNKAGLHHYGNAATNLPATRFFARSPTQLAIYQFQSLPKLFRGKLNVRG